MRRDRRQYRIRIVRDAVAQLCERIDDGRHDGRLRFDDRRRRGPMPPQLHAGGDRQRDQRGRRPAAITAHPVQRVAWHRFVGGAIDEPFADRGLLARVAGHQCAVGDDVDHARNAVRATIQRAQAESRKRRAHATRDGEPMPHVGFGFVAIERREVIARGDALRELAQFRFAQFIAQFRLAEQDDLQEVSASAFPDS